MNVKDKLSSNPLAITNAFNTCFSSVAENWLIKNLSGKNTINNNDSISYLHLNFRQSFLTIQLRNTTMHEIEKIIHSLKCMNAYGYKEISSRILKVSIPYILSVTFIFNKIPSTEAFPDRLKYSEVKPLYKKGDKTEVSNIGLFHFMQHFQKLLKISFIKDCIAT